MLQFGGSLFLGSFVLAVQKFCILQLCLSFAEARHCSVLRFRRPCQQDGVFVGLGRRCVLIDVWFGGRLKMFQQSLEPDEGAVLKTSDFA